jgi:hypothetical protein
MSAMKSSQQSGFSPPNDRSPHEMKNKGRRRGIREFVRNSERVATWHDKVVKAFVNYVRGGCLLSGVQVRHDALLQPFETKDVLSILKIFSKSV